MAMIVSFERTAEGKVPEPGILLSVLLAVRVITVGTPVLEICGDAKLATMLITAEVDIFYKQRTNALPCHRIPKP